MSIFNSTHSLSFLLGLTTTNGIFEWGHGEFNSKRLPLICQRSLAGWLHAEALWMCGAWSHREFINDFESKKIDLMNSQQHTWPLTIVTGWSAKDGRMRSAQRCFLLSDNITRCALLIQNVNGNRNNCDFTPQTFALSPVKPTVIGVRGCTLS